jgi:hypothetical protein
MKTNKYNMIGGSKASKVRSEAHTAKRQKSYTNQSYKAQLKLAGLTGELERKTEKRRVNSQGQLSSDGTRKKSSQLKLEKQASDAFAKVRAANVGIAKHTIRSELATDLQGATTSAEKNSLRTKANAQLKLTQSQANINTAKKELQRKVSRPSQGSSPKTQSILTLEKQISLAEGRKINATTGLQTQNIRNKLRNLQSQSSSKKQKAAEKRLTYYTIQQLKANATQKKATIELQRKLSRTSTNPYPKYTSAMKKLAKQRSIAGTQSKQAGISMEKHQGRLSKSNPQQTVSPFTLKSQQQSGIQGQSGLTSAQKQGQLSQMPGTMTPSQKQGQVYSNTMTMVEKQAAFQARMREPGTGIDLTMGQPNIVPGQTQTVSASSTTPALTPALTPASPSIPKVAIPTPDEAPNKTQLEILKEKEDIVKTHSNELSKLLNSFRNETVITPPKNIVEILKTSGIPEADIAKIKKPDGSINSNALKTFLSTAETIPKLQTYQAKLQANQANITKQRNEINTHTQKLQTIQEKHTQYKKVKSDIQAKEGEIQTMKARQLLLASKTATSSNTKSIEALDTKLATAEQEKADLEANKENLKTELTTETKILQNQLKNKTVNNKTKLIEQNPSVYYGQMIKKEKQPGETEEQTKNRLLASGNETALKIIKLKAAENITKKTKANTNQSKKQTSNTLAKDIASLQEQKLPEEVKTQKSEKLTQIEAEITNKTQELTEDKQKIYSIITQEKEIIKKNITERESLFKAYEQQKQSKKQELNLNPQLDALDEQLKQPGINKQTIQLINQQKEALLKQYREYKYQSKQILLANLDRIKENTQKELNKLISAKTPLLITQKEKEAEINNITKEKDALERELVNDENIDKDITNKTAKKQKIDDELKPVVVSVTKPAPVVVPSVAVKIEESVVVPETVPDVVPAPAQVVVPEPVYITTSRNDVQYADAQAENDAGGYMQLSP